MKASIIVPVFNGEEYIGTCIQSLVDQTYKELEILIINDGSSDRTVDICRSFHDDRIRIVTQENQGVSAARNRGIKESLGDVLLFVDSDDWVDRNFVEELTAPFNDSSISLVACGIIREYSDSSKNVRISKEYVGRINRDLLGRSVLKPGGIEGYMCNKAFRRSVIVENALTVDRDISICEDVKFVMEFIRYCDFAKVIENSIYHYVQHESSARNQSIRGKCFNPKWLSEIKAWEDISKLTLSDAELNEIVKGRLCLASTLYLKRMIRCEYGDDIIYKELLLNCRKYIRYAYKHRLGTRRWVISAAICSISPHLAARI